MINLTILIAIILTISTILSITFVVIDEKTKRPMKRYPFISIIMPTYKDAKYLGKTIESLLSAYPIEKCEMIIINDNSPDNTKDILIKIKEKYSNWITILTNKDNIGKSACVNKASKIAKGEIILILDTDTIVNKYAIEDMIGRLQKSDKIGGVSCRYKVLNRNGFWAIMQDVEYSMLAFIQGSYNLVSTISLWGGCMAIKKKAWDEIGGIKYNYIIEDMNAALELQEKGWKVEQSSFPVYTNVPEKFKDWYKQKIRWGSGFMQCLISHYKIFLKNPIAIIFAFSYTIFMLLFIWAIYIKLIFLFNIGKAIIDFYIYASSFFTGTWYLVLLFIPMMIKNILISISYQIFSLPYLLYDDYYRKRIGRILWIFPYTFIYLPLFTIINILAFYIGIKRYKSLKEGERAW